MIVILTAKKSKTEGEHHRCDWLFQEAMSAGGRRPEVLSAFDLERISGALSA